MSAGVILGTITTILYQEGTINTITLLYCKPLGLLLFYTRKHEYYYAGNHNYYIKQQAMATILYLESLVL